MRNPNRGSPLNSSIDYLCFHPSVSIFKNQLFTSCKKLMETHLQIELVFWSFGCKIAIGGVYFTPSHASNYNISLLKVLQNRKITFFYTFWPKKHPHRCKIVHLRSITTVIVHICTVTVTLLFIILYFFHSPLSSLIWLSLLSHSISLFLCPLNPFIFS